MNQMHSRPDLQDLQEIQEQLDLKGTKDLLESLEKKETGVRMDVTVYQVRRDCPDLLEDISWFRFAFRLQEAKRDLVPTLQQRFKLS